MRALALGRSIRPLPWRTIGVVALLALAIVAGAIIAGSQRRLPPPFGPAVNGQLVTSDAGDIFLIDPDTGVRTLAIGGPGVDSEPAFSRDGTRIAFFREAGGGRGLWLADDRGAGARQLSTNGLVDFSQIEWSPDGKSILLTASVGGQSAPAIVPTDGSAAHIIEIDMPAEGPIWLPSGEIAFRGVASTGFGVFAIRADGTGIRTIVPATSHNADHQYDALFYAPSPDATRIAYQLRDADGVQKIFVVSVAGGTSRALTSIESVGPLWSPDGTWIAFFSEGLYIVSADGSTPERQLVADASSIGASPTGFPVRWTPDSTRLLYVQPSANPILVDPVDGSTTQMSWTATSWPDWQRLAPAR